MTIKITYYRQVENPTSNVHGMLSIKIEEYDLYINGIKEILTAEGKRFFSLPAREYKDKEGETKYQKLVYFGKERSEKFQAALRVALQQYKIANGMK